MHQDFNKGNFPSTREKGTKYEQTSSMTFSKGKRNTKSWRKTTAEVGKKDAHKTSKDVRFLRQPEEFLRAHKPARQGKGMLSTSVLYTFFALDRVLIPEVFGKACVCLLR